MDNLQSLPWYGQLLVFLFIGGILFGIFYMLYYSDQQDQIAGLDRQIDTLETEIKRAEKKEAQLKQIKEEKEAKEKVLEKLKEILPETKEIAQILRKVQSIVSSARLKIQKWTTQAEQRKEVYTAVPFSISVDGSYHDLGLFFDQLSKLKKIFTVNNLTIRPLSKVTGEFTISASFIASTYTYHESTAQRGRSAPRSRGRQAAGGGDDELKGAI
jgi:type IV pilus assembly protein PilO